MNTKLKIFMLQLEWKSIMNVVSLRLSNQPCQAGYPREFREAELIEACETVYGGALGSTGNMNVKGDW